MKRFALNLLALGLVAGFVALGFWQLDRERQKRLQLAETAAALEGDPTGLGRALTQLTFDSAALPPTVRRVAGTARFLPAPPLWLDNQRRGDRVGVRLYCLASAIPASNVAVLVDVGWLPLAGDRRLPAERCPEGEHLLAGLLVAPPSSGLAIGPAVVEQTDGSLLATRLEMATIETLLEPSVRRSSPRIGRVTLGLSAHVLRLDPTLPLGFERDLELLANTLPPEKHRGYALQWFGLATALTVIVLVLNFRRKPQP